MQLPVYKSDLFPAKLLSTSPAILALFATAVQIHSERAQFKLEINSSVSPQKIIFLPARPIAHAAPEKAISHSSTKINWLISSRCRPNKHPRRQGRLSVSLSCQCVRYNVVSFSLALEGSAPVGSIERRRWRKRRSSAATPLGRTRDHPILQVVVWLTFLHVSAVKSLYYVNV